MLQRLIQLLRKLGFFKFNILFLLLLSLNIDNKTFILAGFIYLACISIVCKSYTKGLLFSYLLFLLFQIGKTFEFLLIPGYALSYGRNIVGYQGHYQYIVVGPTFFIGILLFLKLGFELWKKRLTITRGYLLFIGFLLSTFISAVNSLHPLISLFSWVYSLFLFSHFALIKQVLQRDKIFIDQLISFLATITLYQSVYALLQFFKRGNLFSSLEFIGSIPFQSIDMEEYWFRPWSTLEHPNTLANFLLPMFILFFLMMYIRMKRNFRLITAAIFFSFIGIIITLSRSAWISLLIVLSMFLYLFEKKLRLSIPQKITKQLFLLFIIMVPLFLYFVVPRILKSGSTLLSGGSAYSRVELINESISLISNHPFFGVGQGMSVLEMFLQNPKGTMYYFPAPVHNIYLQLLSESGILSTVFLILFFATTILTRRKEKLKRKGILHYIFIASFLGLIINGFFQPLYSITMVYLVEFAVLYEHSKTNSTDV